MNLVLRERLLRLLRDDAQAKVLCDVVAAASRTPIPDHEPDGAIMGLTSSVGRLAEVRLMHGSPAELRAEAAMVASLALLLLESLDMRAEALSR